MGWEGHSSRQRVSFLIRFIDLLIVFHGRKTTENYQFKFLPRELDILPRIQHKNIIKVYQIVQVLSNHSCSLYQSHSTHLQFQKINAYCVVMEWAPGGTLADLLRKDGPLGESRVRGLMTPIFKAVEYLHDKNYAHRDMKLENILLDRIGNPKITDFSYVIDVSRASAPGPKGSTLKGLSGTFCGTEPYLSPEILDQKPYNPFLADTWAIGICLFVLTNNTLPFKVCTTVAERHIYSFIIPVRAECNNGRSSNAPKGKGLELSRTYQVDGTVSKSDQRLP